MVEKNSALKKDWALDIDVLCSYDSKTGYEWTCGPWMKKGDIIFFYHAKGASARVEAFCRARCCGAMKDALIRAEQYATRFAGSIFAYGVLAEDAKLGGRYSAGNHFKTQACAQCSAIHVLHGPLTADKLAHLLQIKRRAPVTPLMRQQARGLWQHIANDTELLIPLRSVTFGDPHFGRVGKKTWLRSIQDASRFEYEHQVREYLAEYLLMELADCNTTILSECRCFRDGRSVGLVDCCVCFAGCWVPVEVKLDASAIQATLLAQQITRYAGAETLVPTIGPHRGKTYKTTETGVCLVVDRNGVYSTKNGHFIKCSPGEPRWPVKGFAGGVVREMKRWLDRSCFNCLAGGN